MSTFPTATAYGEESGRGLGIELNYTSSFVPSRGTSF